MKKNRKLLLGIFFTAVAIGMIETGTVQFMDHYLYANTEETHLILKKGDEIFQIHSGDQVFINGQLMTYLSVEMSSKLLIMKDDTLLFSDVTSIDHVTGTQAVNYGLKGLKYGGILGSTFGAIMAIDEPEYMVLTIPICAGIDGVVLGITGAGYGYTQKTSDRSFELGPDEWTINNK